MALTLCFREPVGASLGPNSLANSLNTKPEDSDKGFKVSAIGLTPNG